MSISQPSWAPFGRSKPVDEPHQTPRVSVLAQAPSWAVMSELLTSGQEMSRSRNDDFALGGHVKIEVGIFAAEGGELFVGHRFQSNSACDFLPARYNSAPRTLAQTTTPAIFTANQNQLGTSMMGKIDSTQ